MPDRNNGKTPIRVASFFAGGGGLDLGFENAGFEVVFATDIDQDCCKTLELNKGISVSKNAEILCGDIRNIDEKQLPQNIDLVVGGPPCQSFSASGRRAGGAAGSLDERGTLFMTYRDIIKKLSPQAFVFENVRGIFATNKGKDWEKILSAFSEIGFNVSFRLLDAADYGVPQHRERVFLVGHKLESEFLFPQPSNGPDSVNNHPHVTPKEAFKDLKIPVKEKSAIKFEGGKYSHLLKDVPEGQNYLFFTDKRGHPKPVFAYRSRFSDFLYKAHPDYPMKTIIASPGKYTGPLHWKNRYFSVAEYKAIQGFPQNYVFHGDRASTIRQIGNSVSPRIAEKVALAIRQQVFGIDCNLRLISSGDSLSFDKRKGVKAKATREMHRQVKANRKQQRYIVKQGAATYKTLLPPTMDNSLLHNITFKEQNGRHNLTITEYANAPKMCDIVIRFWSSPEKKTDQKEVDLATHVYGSSPAAIQLMWNAVDDWARRMTSFHTLFELYGHFTEPYPLFQIISMRKFSDNPILALTKHLSNFENCSQYLPKDDLLRDLGSTFKAHTFDDLARKLRDLRFDVRTRETNIAIPAGRYMIAYPFTLPLKKQMNFSIKGGVTQNEHAQSYVEDKRVENE